ncbi:DUF2771 domain-containing protein [Blastococcus sp. TF02A-35]|uniref:DUF2771 domain-containing protein n=1 Tax=Blastococcus sp. TF02A-35 TaxID=2559612 RepID=UPI001FD7CB24|nr:DUF2771 domain-containing protein [Blastococcus sp. TF02A_35]
MRRPASALLVLGLTGALAGCAGEPEGPGEVRAQAGGQDVNARATQFCLDGDPQRYQVTPPIVEVSPDTAIRLTVPDAVAERGWQVQVFDEQLQEVIGEVDVPEGTQSFDEINSSDVVPPAFYLVVVEDKGGDCGEWTGAWPVGFIRAGGDLGTTPPAG